MTEREMLEMAAKAVGIPLGYDPVSGTNSTWRPLTDHGDRYRLARDLGMCLDFYLGYVRIDGKVMQSFDPRNEVEEAYAIVRAAAEIGKEMS
jgi:hypothetical protein